MREELKKHILNEINKGNHILLVGGHGIGKSYLAKELAKSRNHGKEIWLYFPFCKPPKPIILNLLNTLIKKTNSNSKINYCTSLMDLAYLAGKLSKKLKVVIVLDEIHTISPKAGELFSLFLEQTNITFFCIGNKKYLHRKVDKTETKRFFWELKEIEMDKLTKEESTKLTDNLFKKHKIKDNTYLKDRIIRDSDSNPLAIRQSIEALSKNEWDQRSKGVAKEDSVNLFPVFIVLTFIAIASKYIYRGSGDYEMGNIIAFFGLLFYYILRFAWWKKK